MIIISFKEDMNKPSMNQDLSATRYQGMFQKD